MLPQICNHIHELLQCLLAALHLRILHLNHELIIKHRLLIRIKNSWLHHEHMRCKEVILHRLLFRYLGSLYNCRRITFMFDFLSTNQLRCLTLFIFHDHFDLLFFASLILFLQFLLLTFANI